mmetsp:Transcript_17002/g.23479  ORF Transcript_17002/g.23479 Transcript_17002/m.23479 type:complete len:128 (+) Transcript_17002:479-862(+)
MTGPTSLLSSPFSPKPAAVCNNVDVLTDNKRTCIEIKTKDFGTVIYVLIGATDVASIQLGVSQGSVVCKGQELGYFAYGGSCVVVVFEERSIIFDRDLERQSKIGMETLVKYGSSLGRVFTDSWMDQ